MKTLERIQALPPKFGIYFLDVPRERLSEEEKEAIKEISFWIIPNAESFYPVVEFHKEMAAVLQEGGGVAGFVVDLNALPPQALPPLYSVMEKKADGMSLFGKPIVVMGSSLKLAILKGMAPSFWALGGQDDQ